MDNQARHFGEQYPEIYRGYSAMVEGCRKAGPLDPKTQQLIVIATKVLRQSEKGLKAEVANGLTMGITPDEIRQAILITLRDAGYSTTVAGLVWANAVLGGTPFK